LIKKEGKVTELNDTLDNNKEKALETNAGGDFNIKNHIIICNWTSKADVIVRQLHDESVHERNPIIVITDRPEQVPKSADKAYRGLLIIGGDPADKEILKRADIKYAKTAIILADDEDMENADSKSILIQLEPIRKGLKRGERVIKANTRFAPTKPFRLKVGVNLVFTRPFRIRSSSQSIRLTQMCIPSWKW
jgi:hypothetical protein